MPKTIETLIPDIFRTIQQGKAVSEEHLDLFADECKEALREFFEEGCVQRKPSLRMSGIGTPDRKLWYSFNSPTGTEKFNPEMKTTFMYGHLIEAFVLLLARHAGHKVERQQEEVELEGVKGHIDAFIDGVLTDVKGMSPYGYAKFENGDLLQGNDDFGYVDQISGYAKALKQKAAAFLCMDKARARMTLLHLGEKNLKSTDARIRKVKVMIKQPEPPERCYPTEEDGASGNMKLGKTCGWCIYKDECWSDANGGEGLRKFIYADGEIKYLTKVVKKPRVRELTKGNNESGFEEFE